MRMASALPTLLAVLCGAVAGYSEAMDNINAPLSHHRHRGPMDEGPDMKDMKAWKRQYWQDMQKILRRGVENIRHEPSVSKGLECCPSVIQIVESKAGKTRQGLYVELYEDPLNKQLLYEVSCAAGVADKPCRFIDARLYNQSRCVQKYSYSYALVRSHEGQFNVSANLTMDYVKVRAGCECQITPPEVKTAHIKRQERHRKRRKNGRVDKGDET